MALAFAEAGADVALVARGDLGETQARLERGRSGLTTPEVRSDCSQCPKTGRGARSEGNERDRRSEQKLHRRTKSDLTRAGERWNLAGANNEDFPLLIESQSGRMWFITAGPQRL